MCQVFAGFFSCFLLTFRHCSSAVESISGLSACRTAYPDVPSFCAKHLPGVKIVCYALFLERLLRNDRSGSLEANYEVLLYVEKIYEQINVDPPDLINLPDNALSHKLFCLHL